jgi:hypothetical protein
MLYSKNKLEIIMYMLTNVKILIHYTVYTKAFSAISSVDSKGTLFNELYGYFVGFSDKGSAILEIRCCYITVYPERHTTHQNEI